MAEKKKNISSGAEKAEKLTVKGKSARSAKDTEDKVAKPVKSVKNDGAKKNTKKTTKKSESAEKSEKHGAKKGAKTAKQKKQRVKKERKISEKRAERMRIREEKKLERAKLNAEKKQKKLERKLAHKEARQERKAHLVEMREERREKRKERRDLLKSESKEARRERIAEEKRLRREAKNAKHEAYLAEKKAKREHALKVRAEKRAERNDKRHAPGFGGWLAAVISLGVTTLALGTVVTFGWLAMDDMQADMAGSYTQSLYELNSVIDNLDADLSRARVSSSAGDRVRVLSDIAIESETAETILERFPLDMQMTEQISSFINKMGDSAKSMLYTVANGGELTSSQKQSLNYMYETNAKVKEEINNLISTCKGKDLINAMRGKSNALGEGFANIQNNTFEVPKGIQDGPFSESTEKTNPRALKGAEEITAQAAEKLALQYFADYKVSEAKCTGEATGEAFTLYNVNLTTPDGEMLVQLSKLGGKVVAFDSFKDCSDRNFSVDRCIAIAEDFLTSIGYDGLKPVWVSENSTTCNLNFAPVKDGVILYPDLIKVKVCEERGIVTGVEALSYVLNHGARTIGKATISEAQAQANVSGELQIEGARKALIPFDGEEVLCYEFVGSLDGNEYYVYVDAQTGEEIEVLCVIGTAQGRALM